MRWIGPTRPPNRDEGMDRRGDRRLDQRHAHWGKTFTEEGVVEYLSEHIPADSGVLYSGEVPAEVNGCVYFLFSEDNLVYIGQSIRPAERMKEHTKHKRFDRALFVSLPEEYGITLQKIYMKDIEKRLIEFYRPKYNRVSNTKYMSGSKSTYYSLLFKFFRGELD